MHDVNIAYNVEITDCYGKKYVSDYFLFNSEDETYTKLVIPQ